MDDIPKTSKRRSQVWNHFEIVNQEKAKCNSCGAQLHFRGSTFNLKRHLENKHKDIDISQMLRIKTEKLKYKLKCEPNIQKVSDVDSEDSFYWADGDSIMEKGEHIEETHDILIDNSDQSIAAASDETLGSKDELRVVSFDFQEYTNENDSSNIQDKEQIVNGYNVELSKLIPPPKKRIKKLQRNGNDDSDFRETQIFGDFVASQLRILSKKKREKLQILIQRAILDVVCEESMSQTT